ncbi:trehalose-phosphatase [Sinirhodobacter sp. WL0062]|uniref:Trehalose 6-phosphate phosphatase n=1 Tax=Rhodobacter flavimaris TaxID=2907145 RepID=A0ABS8YU44_9RHOB|nr:trehalose-phosphatase [Sinirhodobacter sp. WL0062]MCE5973213.1 trehalose-phosphatase [Sinirhodobacter sp. WL0062]
MSSYPNRSDRTAPPLLDPARHALFLDFDGTLVEIAPRPDAIVVPPDLPATLSAISEACGGALAIVSGRSLPELAQFLAGFDGLLVGSHGAEARGMAPPLERAPEGLGRLQADLASYAASRGLLYEHKTHGAALHYRHAPEAAETVEAFARAVLETLPGFAMQPAKMAIELRPEGVSKDRALDSLWRLPQFAGRLPVYLGDDRTDEPALDWAARMGGFGIKVGEGDSVAHYRLPDPAGVRTWLGAGQEE